MADVLKVEHLYQSYGGLSVLADVSFNIAAGEKVAIIGPNGAGKTTFFNVLSGFIRPSPAGFTFLKRMSRACPLTAALLSAWRARFK